MNCVVISADNKYIVSGSYDKTVRVWKRESGLVMQELNGHTAEVSSVAIS